MNFPAGRHDTLRNSRWEYLFTTLNVYHKDSIYFTVFKLLILNGIENWIEDLLGNFVLAARVFHKRTKLALLTLLPTLYYNISAVFVFIWT